MFKIFPIVFGLLLLSTHSFAAVTATVTQPMSFGKILQTGEFSVITLYINNEFTDIQNATILANGHVGTVRYSVPDGESANININPPQGISFASSNSAANGEFQIEGSTGTRITVDFPSSVDMGRGMTVNNFNADTGTTFTLDADRQRIRVGAMLNVPRNIPAGTYSGSYTITINY